MTAPRSPRSASLLVGWTPSIESKVQSAGQIFSVAREAPSAAVARALAGVAGEDRLQPPAQHADAALENCAVAGVLKDLPGPEQLVADPQAGFAEFLLGGEPVGMHGKVTLQM
jgi:hypothetical protein